MRLHPRHARGRAKTESCWSAPPLNTSVKALHKQLSAILAMCALQIAWAGDASAIQREPADFVDGSAASVAGSTAAISGPDVIVGSLYQVASYGSSNGISAFAVGTYSCNVGDEWLNWFPNNNQHPVIAQNMFRLKNGRFEQIGQSWLKHGFYALSNNLCHNDCQPTDGTHLGVHCADPYSAALNGTQNNLGPKWQVDAHTGTFPFPPTNPAYSGIIARRLQVRNSDLDPAQNGGGQYYVEGQYVTADDAAWGKQNNNASYRPVNVETDGSSWFIDLTGTTQRTQPAIRAWNDADATVRETDLQIAGEGLFILAAKVSDLGGGWWHYEYAVQNLNSHRSAKSFSIPFDPTGTIINIGFHDVDYHSGEPFSPVDWTATTSNGVITWSTQDFAVNANANALRWGTLYNFRFDINRQPQTTTATLGLFRPGPVSEIAGSTIGPILSPADCNENGVPDSIDIVEGDSIDCDSDTIPDECESFAPAAYQVATGLDRPVQATAPANDARLFIGEESGRIKILSNGTILATPFLNLASLVMASPDNGLLSMAFDPEYASNGRFYVAYTNTAGSLVVARYNVSSSNINLASPSSALILKTVGPASTIRSGGQIAFGPDGYLYVGVGDSGAANDPLNHAQDTGSLRGKILRLDVNSPPNYIPQDNPFVGPGLPLDEIWTIGVRDPWRFSFDPESGELYLADRGQNLQDEVNIQTLPAAGGESFGWRCTEGATCTGLTGCTCNGPTLTPPQFVHTRQPGECGITGGFVYRGCALPNFQGAYFYADSCSGSVRSFRFDGSAVTDHQDWTSELAPAQGSLTSIVSFGEDAAGELYLVDYSGSIFRIVPQSGTDCGNGAIDPGEQCDDGNTNAGDGCDAFCRIEPGPANDRCFNAISISEQTLTFDTAGALTGGPDEVEACQSEPIMDIIGSDVWYCYTASCSGTATVDLCGSGFDTIAAVYEGCSCPSSPSAAGCSDGGCFAQSILNFPVTACSSYLVRVGGFVGDQGPASMTVSCAPNPIQNDCNLNSIDDEIDISCGAESDTNSNLVPDSCETDGDPIRGGRLYDRWWSQTGAGEPNIDHPLWEYRPDTVSNPATGGATWRCSECHGWDYKGVEGQYGAGSHRTGFDGILHSTLSAPAMFDLLKSPPSNGGGAGVLNGHDYETVLSDGAINDLVAFVLLGTLDDTDYINSGTKAFLGDAQAGQANYSTGGTISQCGSCHGPQGADINFGTVQNPAYLGTVATNNPWEFLHRARMGFPGTPMQGWLANGGTDQGAADIGRYAQLSFPTECVDDSQCGDSISCTVDSCDPAGRCQHVENDSGCADDGTFCNGAEYCDAALGCTSLGNPCSVSSACDESADFCGCLPPLVHAAGSRYLAITPQQSAGSPIPMALRIRAQCELGNAKYLGAPAGAHNTSFVVEDVADAAWLTPAQWGTTVYVSGFEIAPGVTYTVEADCGLPGRTILTNSSSTATHKWGDVISRISPQLAPDGIVDFADISALVDGFRATPNVQPLYRLDLFGCVPNQSIDFIDIAGGVDAFRGKTYQGGSLCPGPCW